MQDAPLLITANLSGQEDIDDRTDKYDPYHQKPGCNIPLFLYFFDFFRCVCLHTDLDIVMLQPFFKIRDAGEHVVNHKRLPFSSFHIDTCAFIGIRHGIVDLRKAPMLFIKPCELHLDIIVIHMDFFRSGERLDQKE